VAALTVVLLAVAMSIFAPLLAPYNPNAIDFSAISAPPSSLHWFGTDALGRDIFSRWLLGIRYPLVGSILIVVISNALACLLAIAMAWFGGWVDAVLARLLDIFLAFPGILLALLAITVFGNGMLPAVLALSIAHAPYVARVIRSVALRERRMPYIEALLLQGFGAFTVNVRHLLRNLTPYIVGQATLTFSGAFVALASLSFLGLGAQPPTADWGTMLADGLTELMAGHPSEVLAAGLSIVVLVLAVNLVGERFPQERGR
jgi:peptide/nickel transport system permease protein